MPLVQISLPGASIYFSIIKEYSYFSYNANEALHLSEQERKVVIECINNVAEELRHPIDKHSRSLIIDTMKLLLDRCIRFYDRQFITRENEGVS